MIVTFSTRLGRITMFSEPALALLRMLGHSGRIPGAIRNEDLPAALEALRAGLAAAGHVPSPAPGETEEPLADDRRSQETAVNLNTRAVPLIEMIERAIAANSDLMWDKG